MKNYCRYCRRYIRKDTEKHIKEHIKSDKRIICSSCGEFKNKHKDSNNLCIECFKKQKDEDNVS